MYIYMYMYMYIYIYYIYNCNIFDISKTFFSIQASFQTLHSVE